ncbi:MAG TPA: hypothetical protein VGF95_14290 [Solirubrobacteraceae bacterium]|jgi:hypothetical protein
MTEDLARLVIHPATGELLDLDQASTDQLGHWLLDARELDQRVREEKRAVTQEILARMDREARHTFHGSDLELKGDGPKIPTEYDATPLRAELQEFVDGQVISPEALDRAIEVQEVLKPRAEGLNALRALGGPIAECVERHAHPKERHERKVSVKLRSGAARP